VKAVINALALPSFQQGGAGYYTATLIDGLSDPRKDLFATALLSPPLAHELARLAPEARVRIVSPARPSAPRRLVNYAAAARAPERLDLGFSGERSPEADIVHWPISFMYAPAAPRGARRVLTVLDLQHELFPQFFSRRDRILRRLRWPPSARAADHVIAISDFTKRTVCERYGVPAERVTAVPLGLRRSLMRAPAPAALELPPRLEAASHWFLYPASPLPAKNHPRLLAAFRLYRERVDRDALLVLTGPRLHSWAAVERRIAEAGLAEAVVVLGHVDDVTLRALYARCTGLIFPSLFEGFGLPALEAMAVGCPVAASNAGSLPEVVGDAGRMFAPEDVEEIAAALEWLASLDGRARAAVVTAGRERAGLFSTEAMIDQTLGVYEDLLEG
jgi:glycosyltransferase involved in cell wall biosynthesis